MPAEGDRYLVSCEHGGNVVPPPYRSLFTSHKALLDSHRGWDPGALALARDLARSLPAPLFYATVSRLVIDLNRSLGHPRLYSEVTRAASKEVRKEILAHCYLPYRQRVEEHIAQAVARGCRVVHVSSHSFTFILNGAERQADVGLLYDPARPGEASFAKLWQAALKTLAPQLKVRRNYPYTGTSDGFTVYLRKRFSAENYIGVELEINQKHVAAGTGKWRELRQPIIASLKQALQKIELQTPTI